MNAGIHIQHVVNVQRDVITFTKADQGRWQGMIDACCQAFAAIDHDRELADMEIELRARQRVEAGIAGRGRSGPGGQERSAGQGKGTCSTCAQKMSSGKHE